MPLGIVLGCNSERTFGRPLYSQRRAGSEEEIGCQDKCLFMCLYGAGVDVEANRDQPC